MAWNFKSSKKKLHKWIVVGLALSLLISTISVFIFRNSIFFTKKKHSELEIFYRKGDREIALRKVIRFSEIASTLVATGPKDSIVLITIYSNYDTVIKKGIYNKTTPTIVRDKDLKDQWEKLYYEINSLKSQIDLDLYYSVNDLFMYYEHTKILGKFYNSLPIEIVDTTAYNTNVIIGRWITLSTILSLKIERRKPYVS